MPAATFDLTLTPNRPFGFARARWLVGAVGVIFLIGSLRFLALGAWPVLPFMAVDTALLWWAFRASDRDGRAFETVRLAGDRLEVRQVSSEGREHTVSLEPYWTCVRLERASALENRLWLEARGTRIAVGRLLSPAEREDIAKVIEDGLRRFRAG